MFEPLKFQGHVENNAIVSDENVTLPEGKKVSVQVSVVPEAQQTLSAQSARQLEGLRQILEYAKTLNFPPDFEFDRGEANDRDGIF